MDIYSALRNIYVNTLRRSKFIHQSLYWIAQEAGFPIWERILAFHSHPDDPLSIRFAMLSGKHEEGTISLVKQIVKPGMVVLDIGAHVGYYSRLLAKLVRASGKVIAFEPNPETFQLLTKNMARFRNVTCLEVAAVDEEMTLTLYDGQLETGMSGLCDLEDYRQWTKQLSTEFAPRAKQGYPFRSFTVKGRPVDQCLAEMGITSVDFVKMDIEGAEMKALKGMKGCLSSSPNLVMVMEFNPRLLQAFGVSPREVIDILKSYGFTHIEAICETTKPIDLAADEFDEWTRNLIAGFSMVNLLCRKTNRN